MSNAGWFLVCRSLNCEQISGDMLLYKNSRVPCAISHRCGHKPMGKCEDN